MDKHKKDTQESQKGHAMFQQRQKEKQEEQNKLWWLQVIVPVIIMVVGFVLYSRNLITLQGSDLEPSGVGDQHGLLYFLAVMGSA